MLGWLSQARHGARYLLGVRRPHTRIQPEDGFQVVVRGAVAGSVVPRRVAGMGPEVLAVEYRQILQVLAESESAEGTAFV
ncbi:hypothetical protein OHB05_00855 [Streptomyces sp. NBC_00638]|uniref:hypothetical protein n=1 Tax=unclassified Streptomyces TaxID=2593676 RepID=UPI00224F9079|nr:hypothetical protein [Streptomyces sp. NBC_00638]MCX5001178.1 hypothetical protein [Streptomyces sp. NBC_00638]